MVIRRRKIKGGGLHSLAAFLFYIQAMLFSLAFSFSLFLSSTLASPVAVQGFDFKDINTMISFGDSYTMRNINLTDLTYMCRDCTSAGGPNYVVYLEDYTKWVSWDLAFGGAPVNNALVHKVSDALKNWV